MAPITLPSGSRSAEALRVVGMTSPLALRGLRRALRVTPLLDDFAQRRGELAGLLGADEAGQRLLEQLVRAEPEQLGDGVVGLQDLAFEVRDEHRVRRVLDQALGVGAGFVQLAHVAQDADRADHPAVGVAQRGGVERRGNHLAARAARVEPGIAGDAALHDFAQRGQ